MRRTSSTEGGEEEEKEKEKEKEMEEEEKLGRQSALPYLRRGSPKLNCWIWRTPRLELATLRSTTALPCMPPLRLFTARLSF